MDYVIGGLVVLVILYIVCIIVKLYNSKDINISVSEDEYKEYLLFLKENSKERKNNNE